MQNENVSKKFLSWSLRFLKNRTQKHSLPGKHRNQMSITNSKLLVYS